MAEEDGMRNIDVFRRASRGYLMFALQVTEFSGDGSGVPINIPGDGGNSTPGAVLTVPSSSVHKMRKGHLLSSP
ncbi:hypothetical protein CEXT_159391 [Caerostris extrusa]|uniref:Uncharacterized protein n=1 Tax=Caerostris extrusa TaxID=172846 RepID=A0AAV4T4N6_CAEEX|nr:hypothetical protein CEXT_159391 [Caerostris extrusa]